MLINQIGSLLCEKGGQFDLARLFWLVVCEMGGHLS